MLLAREAFEIFGITIYWYAVCIVSGMLLAMGLCAYLSKYRGFKAEIVTDLVIALIPAALLGARIYYALFDNAKWTFVEFWNFRSGGLAIYGGIIGGAIGLVVLGLIKKWKLNDYLSIVDIIVPCLILAQGIGRWGNFANQEAYGNLVTNAKWQFFPYAVYIEAKSAWYQATFFYEFVWNIIGAVLLVLGVIKIKDKNGLVGCAYFAFYGIGRFFIEGLRSDSLYIGAIRVSQLVSLLMIAASVAAGLLLLKHYKKMPEQVAQTEQNSVSPQTDNQNEIEK